MEKPLFVLNSEFIKDHVVVEGRILLDTGAPISIGKNSVELVLGENLKFEVHLNDTVLAMAEKHVDVKLEYLMGIDIIERYSILIEKKRVSFFSKEYTFNEQDRKKYKEIHEYETKSKFPMFEMSFSFSNKKKSLNLSTYFDSGAPINYMCSEYLKEIEPTKKVLDDFHPSCGEFKTKIWNVGMKLGKDKTVNEEFGVLPTFLETPLMGCFGIECIVGTNFLRMDFSVFVNLKKGKILFCK